MSITITKSSTPRGYIARASVSNQVLSVSFDTHADALARAIHRFHEPFTTYSTSGECRLCKQNILIK